MSDKLTRKQIKARKLKRAKEDYEFVCAAVRAIIGGAQQYSMGSRSVSKASLDTLLKERTRLEDLIDAFEGGAGRFKRVVTIDR